MSADGVNGPLTPDGPKWTATEDHSVVEVEAGSGQLVRAVRGTGHVALTIAYRRGPGATTVVLTFDELRLLGLTVPEPEPVATGQGDMRPMWTFEGDDLRRLLDDLDDSGLPLGQSPIYRVRFAVDEGVLKWKINEDTWSVGHEPDEERS